MDPYLTPKEYKKPTHIQENVERVFKQTTMSRKVFDTITQEINIPVETIMLLLESSVEVAHKIYVDNMKCIGRENEKLQGRAKRMHGHMSVFRKREEGADCGDSSDNREKEIVRDMFFYDILRYWKEEVFRIQVKQQHKYKFARTYSYDAAAGLKARQERDKWQLIRDLTEDEMKENWKIIAYFIDSKIMELAVEASFKERDIKRIWSVRNFKTIFRGIETEGRKEINKTVNSSTVNSTPRTPQNVGQDDIMSYECEKNDEKIKYEQYKDPENMEENTEMTESINRKLEKLGDIFKATSKEIEWETIRSHQRHWIGVWT
ncbi:hypothetical protein GLOIN_2v1881393 [Rhizophagus irregularis DAOM 181602=DAOM 197198]|nr:hypothetical protein GLOIN_2v1881393 [Rhizophagus irregularis DAOM 181602=DAOM 197198]